MKKEAFINTINPRFFNGICHRGLHNKLYTENGLLAFKNAIDHNLAFEFDIHLTKDNQPIVIHDSNLFRVTNKDGIVEELTLAEIKNNYILLNGEKIPTLEEVLALNNEKVPMVIELKIYKNNYHKMVTLLLEKLQCIRDKKNVMLISFDPRAMLKLRKKGFPRQLLVEIKYKWVYHLRFFFDSLDLEVEMLNWKKVQKYAKKHFINVWTIDDLNKLALAKKYADVITFQNLDYHLVKEVSQENNI